MNRRTAFLTTTLLAVVSMVSMACASLTVPPPPGVKSAPAPTPKPGSWWVLRALDGSWTARFELKRVTDDGRFIVTINGRETEFTSWWNALENVADPRTIRAKFSPHDYSFDFPIWEGKQWGGIVAWVGRWTDMTQGTFSVWAEAKGWEKITIPAGTFEAIKARIQTARILVICWYAPEAQFTAKCVSPTHSRRSWELAGFHLE